MHTLIWMRCIELNVNTHGCGNEFCTDYVSDGADIGCLDRWCNDFTKEAL